MGEPGRDDAGEPPRALPRPLPRWSLRNRRVRTRLVALIAVPTIVAIVLGVVVTATALTSAAAYGRTTALARLAGSVTATTADLQAEQARAAEFVGAGRPAAGAGEPAQAQARTDGDSAQMRRDVAAVDDSYADSTRDRVRRALFRLDTLPALRSAVTADRLPAGVTVDKYSAVVTDLIAVDDEISQDSADPGLSASVRALGSLSRAKAALATQHGLLGAALSAGRFEPGGFDALTRAVAAQESAETQFRTSASPAQVQSYDDVVAGADVDDTSARLDGVTAAAGAVPGGRPAADAWDAAVSGTVDKIRTVESGLLGSIADRAQTLRTQQVERAILAAVVALLVIVAVLVTTIAVARSLVRPLRALRTGALAVAQHRLPDVVSRLGSEDPDTVDTRVEPIAVHSGDEIGEVARSFDEVHREAIRLAGAEARRRAQTGALFVNLSRRTQSLVDRQIELIDDLEQGEEDPDRLGNLFALDHLATRMRRNGENLLVLGGQEPVRRWNRVLPLLDVLRAAISEVERYERVDLSEVPPVFVASDAVSDVVHLLAELLDNATAFSSRSSRVQVVATALPDGSGFVEITDRGIGLSEDECAELDARLAEPAEVDAGVSRRMGLYVVARLASRQGVRVRLHPSEPRGVTAAVALPAWILTTAPVAGPAPAEVAADSGDDGTTHGAWIGERWSKAVSTPGPGPDSWFGGASLAAGAAAGIESSRSGTGAHSAQGPSEGRRQPAEPAPAPESAAGAAFGAASAFSPMANGTTAAGLPRRDPGANTVPGALPPGAAEGPGPAGSGAPAPGDGPSGAADHSGPGDDATRPIPVVRPGDVEASDRSPASIRRRYAGYQQGRSRGRIAAPPHGERPIREESGAGAAGQQRREATRVAAPDPQPAAPESTWAAPAVREPTAAGTTASGLPLRDPGANYVPGAVPEGPGPRGPAGEAEQRGDAAAPAEWDRSAEAIRRRFAAHQQGRRRGMESRRR